MLLRSGFEPGLATLANDVACVAQAGSFCQHLDQLQPQGTSEREGHQERNLCFISWTTLLRKIAKKNPNFLQRPDHPRPLQKVGLKFWQSCFKKPIQKFHCTQKATSQKLSYFIWNEQVMTTFFHSRELTSHMVHTCSSYTSAALLAFLSLASVSMNSLVQGLSNCTSSRCEQPSA